MQLLTIQETADRLSISRQSVEELIDRGRLSSTTVFGRRVVLEHSVVELERDPTYQARSKGRRKERT